MSNGKKDEKKKELGHRWLNYNTFEKNVTHQAEEENHEPVKPPTQTKFYKLHYFLFVKLLPRLTS